MRFTYVFFFLSFPFFLSAQGESSIDIIGGIDYTFIHGDSGNNSVGTIFNLGKNRATKGAIGWRAGLNYNKRISESIFLKTGVRIANARIKTELLTGLMWGSEHDSTGEWAGPDPSLPHEIQTFHSFLFVEIPISVRYEFSETKLKPFVETGIASNIFLNSTTMEVTDIGSTEMEFSRGIKPLNFVLLISGGIIYELNEKYKFICQPSFRYHLTSIERMVGSPEHLYNFGIELGLRKSLH